MERYFRVRQLVQALTACAKGILYYNKEKTSFYKVQCCIADSFVDLLQGEWRNNKRCGKGVCVYQSGAVYDGEAARVQTMRQQVF